MSHGLPEARARMLVGLFDASRNGEFPTANPTLEYRLAARPVSMRDVRQLVSQAGTKAKLSVPRLKPND